MDKDETKKLLTEQGYKMVEEDGVLIALVNDVKVEKRETEYKKLCRLIKSMGYNKSFGMRFMRGVE